MAIVAGSVLVIALPGWRRALGFPVFDKPAYAAGERVDVPARIYDSTPFSVLIFTRSSCGACERARPVIADLVDALRDRASVRLTMIVDADAQAVERQHLRDIGLAEDRLAAADFRTLRLRRVPTTLLVDRDGRVLHAREGELLASDAAELLRIATSVDAVR